MKKRKITAAVLASVITGTGLAQFSGGIGLVRAAGSDVCINEVCSQNKSCLTDGYGKHADWIELYNAGSSAVDLSGYGLTDKAAEPLKFTFPANTTIPAKGYLVVFASDDASTGSELHTGFSISKNGETITLSDPNGSLIQQVIVPTLGEDKTYGRTPDGSGTLEIMDATPAKANAYVVSAPVFSEKSGFYGSEFQLSLSAAAGTQIYYTTDGSDPTSSNTAQVYHGAIRVQDRTNQPNLYSAYGESESANSICRGIGYQPPSYNVDKGMVVRAAAKDQNGKFSASVSQTYFIASGNLGQYRNMTVVSLVTNPDNLFSADKGIYVTGDQYMAWRNSGAYNPNKSIWDTDNVTNYFSRGKNWEREAEITIFENGTPVVQQGMGIRIKGASTRNHAQKSFNLYARSEYGASKIAYPLFADNYTLRGELIDKYDSVTLRSITDEARLNDSLSQSLLYGREDIATQAMKPCIVFLNGEYWGMYEMTERLSAYYIESNFGIPKQNVAMLKNSEPEEGDDAETQRFLDFADEYAKKDLRDAANYKAVCDFIDIDSMIDHYAAGLYLGTFDWPNRNYGAWRNTGEPIEGNRYSDGKWRFITFDLDYTLGATYADFGGVEGYAYDSFRHMEGELKYAPTNLFKKLLENDEFRAKFAGVFCDYANEIVTTAKGTALADQYSREYGDLIAANLLRWWGFYGGSPSDTYDWNKQNYQGKVISGIKSFFQQREGYALGHMKNYLGINGSLQTITLQTAGHGKIRINSITPDAANGWTGKYYSDMPVTLTAVPDEGYAFDGWGKDAAGKTEQTIQLTLSQAMTVSASFTEKKTVKGDVNANGKLSLADAVMTAKWLGASGSLTDWQAGDLNGDGVITAADLSLLKRLLMQQ